MKVNVVYVTVQEASTWWPLVNKLVNLPSPRCKGGDGLS